MAMKVGVRIVYRCETCNEIFEAYQKGIEHLCGHIRRGEIFSAPCKLNGQPVTGVCILEAHYKQCQTRDEPYRTKNNWMCSRDQILITMMEKPS